MTLGVLLNLSGPRFLLEREDVIIPTSQCFPENSTCEFESFGKRPGEEGATPCTVISWHIPAAVGSGGQASPEATPIPVPFQSHKPIHHLILKSDCVFVLQMCSARSTRPKLVGVWAVLHVLGSSGLLWARPGDWARLRLLFAEAPGLGWTAGRWPSIMTTDCVLARPWPLMPLPPPQQKLASLP